MKSKNFEYKYIVTGNKVIALSRDAGKVVRGVARCSANDTFDVEFGKKLAAARCNVKIAVRREKRAANKWNESAEQYYKAKRRYDKFKTAVTEATEETDKALKEVYKILYGEEM